MKILIAGDFVPRNRVAKLFDNNQFCEVLKELKQYTEDSDVSIVNLETPIVNDPEVRQIKKIGANFRTNTSVIEALKYAGFDAVTLANNHLRDYGNIGVNETISHLRNADIEYVGAGRNLSEAAITLYKSTGGGKIAIVNCCEHEFSIATKNSYGCNPIDPIDTARQIRAARTKSDRVIVITHGGIEHYQLPSPRMKNLYRFFIENGADAVINHHQHCYSGYEVYNGKPIFYGLGNLCFDSPEDIQYRHSTFNYGFMIKLEFSEADINYELLPYEQCYKEPTIHFYKKNSEDYLSFENKISELNTIISDDDRLNNLFEQNARMKKNYVYGFMRPYSSRFFQFLFNHGLVPSFISKRKMLLANSIINCETHREILLNNLKHGQ